MKHVYKQLVPVDDAWHPLHGEPVAAAYQDGRVAYWYEHDEWLDAEPAWEYRVYGTGPQFEIPDEAEHVGTDVVGPLVLHLYRRPLQR